MAHDSDPRVRGPIVHVLCDESPVEYRAEIVRVLESLYHDEDDRVRKQVRRVLAQYRHSGRVNVL